MKIQKIVVCSSTSFQLMGDELIQLGRRKKMYGGITISSS